MAPTTSNLIQPPQWATTQSQNLNLWFIQLRWVACGVALLLIFLTIQVLHYLDEVVFWPLLGLVAVLAISNLIYLQLLRKGGQADRLKMIQIVGDLLILTAMLHFSGGIENPLSFVYLFHVMLSGILLDKKNCYSVVAIVFILYTGLALCELSEIIPHYTLDIFPHKVNTEFQSDAPTHHTENGIHAAHYPVYVWSMSLLNLFISLLTAFFVTNIMSQLRAEEAKSREERQRLEYVLQSTGAGLLILDKTLHPVWYNEPVKQWLKLPDENASIGGENFSQWIDPQDGAVIKTLRDGRIRTEEREQVDESGQKQYFQVTVAPLHDAQGEIYQVVELVQDITEKKNLEAEMLHAAKMVTLGTMSAGIAHEVGNPLASISTRLQLMETENDPDFISQSLHLLKREISRIERIVRGISQFGRPSREGWGTCQVNQILEETVEMLKYHKSAKICRIETRLQPGLPETLGVRDQLKQVFLNLGLNALEAMPGGGKLCISSSQKSGNLVVEFADEGTGISEEVCEKIFQPFFTTKEKGSGLGLFIVHHFVHAHGGEIQFDSQPGRGTRVKVLLPLRRSRQSITTTRKSK
jgi:signal transduction histidine kinase